MVLQVSSSGFSQVPWGGQWLLRCPVVALSQHRSGVKHGPREPQASAEEATGWGMASMIRPEPFGSWGLEVMLGHRVM